MLELYRVSILLPAFQVVPFWKGVNTDPYDLYGRGDIPGLAMMLQNIADSVVAEYYAGLIPESSLPHDKIRDGKLVVDKIFVDGDCPPKSI